MNVGAIIVAVENLIAFLLELKANGQLTDDQLDSYVSTTNSATRDLIKQALAGQGPLAPPPAQS